MKILAYLSYGGKKCYQLELYFSILSALHFLRDPNSDIRICVISDRPKDFGNHPLIDQLSFSPAEFAEWTHGTSPHRAKICALMKVMDQYRCPVALIDSDTYFLDHPSKLFERITPQQSVMFGFEHILHTDLLWQPLFEKLGDRIEFGNVYLDQQSAMFNAGVVGLDFAHRSLLDQALALADQLNKTHHGFTDEQLAFSIILSQVTNLSLSDDLIRHYWGWYERRFIHIQIDRLFKGLTGANLERLAADPTPVNFEDAPPVSVKDRLISKLLGLIYRWDHEYKFAYFSYRNALTYAAKDQDYANAWAAHTLRGVKTSLIEHPSAQYSRHLQRDFRHFSQDSIEGLDWLNGEVKESWLQFWQHRSQNYRYS
ncbi:MAG TPA: hypothetical protein VL134_13400 [Leptolyngbya sp.]|jgi:hypothetical protein|nr:hypothetical protein [Leptolyngbya sp.]